MGCKGFVARNEPILLHVIGATADDHARGERLCSGLKPAQPVIANCAESVRVSRKSHAG